MLQFVSWISLDFLSRVLSFVFIPKTTIATTTTNNKKRTFLFYYSWTDRFNYKIESVGINACQKRWRCSTFGNSHSWSMCKHKHMENFTIPFGWFIGWHHRTNEIMRNLLFFPSNNIADIENRKCCICVCACKMKRDSQQIHRMDGIKARKNLWIFARLEYSKGNNTKSI